jgi:hypothetical protein
MNNLGEVIQGTWGPGNIPDELKIYDKDKAGGLLYIEQGTTKLMHMIHKEFGKRDVTSFTPKWFDIGQLDDVFTVTAVQLQATFKKIEMANEQAIQLQPGDLLAVDGLFMEDGANGGVFGTYSTIWNRTARNEEMLLVEHEPVADSSRTGYAWIEVRRGYANNYTTGRIGTQPTFATAGVTALLPQDARLLKMGNTHWTGGDAPRGMAKNPEIDSNPLQIMRFAFESQKESNWERNFNPEDPMTIAQKLALKRMAFEMEYRALFSVPVIEAQGNSLRYTTGGLFHYVENVIDYSLGGTVNNYGWLEFQKNVMAPLFDLGGSGTKVAYCSISQFSNLANLLWNKVTITVNEAWSKMFKFEIYKIAGGMGELNIVPSWVYGRNRFRANQMLVLDFGGPYFKIDVLEDVHINRGPNGTGLQLNGQNIKKYEYTGTTGLQRRAKQYHAIIAGLPSF